MSRGSEGPIVVVLGSVTVGEIGDPIGGSRVVSVMVEEGGVVFIGRQIRG